MTEYQILQQLESTLAIAERQRLLKQLWKLREADHKTQEQAKSPRQLEQSVC